MYKVTGYSDYTGNPLLTTELQAGSTYNCTVYAGQYTEGYAAWIDYNDDGVFDNTTEKIGNSTGQVTGSGTAGVLGSSAVFQIHLACNPAVGQHRLRVRAMYNVNGNLVTPCGNNSFGEVEDYLITITAPAACPQPSALGATAVTATSATLNWTIGCAETAWEVVVQPTGSGVPAGAGTPVATNSYPATFASGTSNEFYVRADCSGDGYSLWSWSDLYLLLLLVQY
ncbi:GEVED domain-containing protein [Flavobacterium sp. 3HN19-14]|uniref:GEVED domain-containing protein n=1 Tax=Flavobacterium sp. 3HN19-14 TaxID=3448133 RepID=UPI003EDFD34F